MTLCFLRHGSAVERNAWSGEDAKRPLTEGGAAVMERMAEYMVSAGLAFDAIVASPYTRARRTAEIVAGVLGLGDRLTLDSRLEPGFGPGDLEAMLHDYAGSESILLVGHESDFSEVIGSLIGGGRVEVKKGALACVKGVTVKNPRGELAWLLPPSLPVRNS
jgi:phosphohistidine phosphatase